MRKKPNQARARATVTAILDATAQLLAARKEAEVTTNRIAERAGVSIGPLYQYFDGRDAVYYALARREGERIAHQVIECLHVPQSEVRGERARNIVRLLIAYFSDTDVIGRVAMLRYLAGLREGERDDVMDIVSAEIETLLNTSMGGLGSLSRVKSYILTRSILNVVRSAMMDDPDMLKSREFEDELVLLIRGYLMASRQSDA